MLVIGIERKSLQRSKRKMNPGQKANVHLKYKKTLKCKSKIKPKPSYYFKKKLYFF